MLETMPEEARLKVLEFTKKLFTSERPANPYQELTAARILGELEESRNQIARGEGLDMESALDELGRKHGFI
ncbi:MAG: hypothetical protein IJU29_05840 [Oscillospiraceae bacterium]|nr:hypothetical protein [Oscillospiraceae bacterium]